MARYYVDTSIWRDLLEDRRDNIKPLSEFAFKFMQKILDEKHTIVFSKEIEVELRKRFKIEQINELIIERFAKENLVLYVEADNSRVDEAEKLSLERKIPVYDALHAILARANQAILVTRDKHYEELQDIAEIKTPEQVIF